MALANVSLIYAIGAFPLGVAFLLAGVVAGRRGPLNLWSGGLTLFGALITDTAIFAFIYWYLTRLGVAPMIILLTGAIIAVNGLIFLLVFGFMLIRRG